MPLLSASPVLRRDIGGLGAAFIALNGVIGAGVFAMPQALAAGVGAASPYLILVFGAPMIVIAFAFGLLAARSEATGGPVAYASDAFGPTAGFSVGWLYYLARLASTAANANALLTYLAVFAPGLDQGLARLAMLLLLLGGLTALNVAGVKGAVRTLSWVTALKLAPLAALVIAGLMAFPPPAPQTPSDAAAVGGVSLLLLYAFVGFEMATLTAGETRGARRALPWALVGTVAAMTVLYFLVQLSYVAVMQGRAPGEGQAPLAAAAEILFGPIGALAIAAAALISIGGNLLASAIVTPRLTFAMAEDGTLPRWFGAVSARFHTPANSILAFGAVAMLLAMSSAFVWLAAMAALARMFVYLVCMGALLRQARTAHGLWGYALAGVGAGLCIWAIAQAKPDAWIFLATFSALGAAVYVIARRRAAT